MEEGALRELGGFKAVAAHGDFALRKISEGEPMNMKNMAPASIQAIHFILTGRMKKRRISSFGMRTATAKTRVLKSQ